MASTRENSVSESRLSDHAEADQAQEKFRPTVAVIYFVISNVMFSLNFLFAKLLYATQPDLSTVQIILIRSIISMIVVLLALNKNMKFVMWDNVRRENLGPLLFRVVQGNITIYIQFAGVKFFTLVTIGVITQLVPFVQILMAYFILHEESLNLYQWLGLLGAFGGAVMVIVGGNDSQDTTQLHEESWVGYLILASLPFVYASATVAVRMMRKMHEAVIVCYMNLSLIVSMTIIMWIQGDSLNIVSNFTAVDWTFMVLLSFSTLGNMIFRFKALQNWTVSKLSNLLFLFPIIYFFYDVVLFDVTYSYVQIAGALLTVLVYIVLLAIEWWPQAQDSEHKETQLQPLITEESDVIKVDVMVLPKPIN